MDQPTLARYAPSRIIPVVIMNDPDAAVPLARALVAGGIGVAEVTLRTEHALECLRAMARVPGFVVGAGTALTGRSAADAIAAGAAFVVSPGFSPEVDAVCRRHECPYLPGVATATEVTTAYAAGHRVLKLFPAELVGGVGLLKAFASPFPEVTFVPTGGVGQDNATEYLALGNVAAVGGSWMVPRSLVDAGDMAAVTALVARAVAAS